MEILSPARTVMVVSGTPRPSKLLSGVSSSNTVAPAIRNTALLSASLISGWKMLPICRGWEEFSTNMATLGPRNDNCGALLLKIWTLMMRVRMALYLPSETVMVTRRSPGSSSAEVE